MRRSCVQEPDIRVSSEQRTKDPTMLTGTDGRQGATPEQRFCPQGTSECASDQTSGRWLTDPYPGPAEYVTVSNVLRAMHHAPCAMQ